MNDTEADVIAKMYNFLQRKQDFERKKHKDLEKYQSQKNLQKEQQKEDITMTNELAEMMRLAGMTESKGSKPDYLDFDKDGNKEEPMKQALKDKKVDEADMEEGNEFSGELAKARAQHKDSFTVDGKKYPVKENEHTHSHEHVTEGTCKSCHKAGPVAGGAVGFIANLAPAKI